MTTKIAGAVALGAALAAAGCGGKTISQQSEVNLVKKGLARANAPAAKSIDCPDGVDATVGKTFDCNVVLQDGTKARFTIKVTAVNGNNGQLKIIAAKKV